MLNKRLATHILLPSLAPVLIVCLYLTPKHVFGCANRGLMALTVAFVALIAAITTGCKWLSFKRQGNAVDADWWLFSTIILLFAIFLLVGPLR